MGEPAGDHQDIGGPLANDLIRDAEIPAPRIQDRCRHDDRLGRHPTNRKTTVAGAIPSRGRVSCEGLVLGASARLGQRAGMSPEAREKQAVQLLLRGA